MTIDTSNLFIAFWQSVRQILNKAARVASFLVFQEKCRICQRFIHPDIANMNLEVFRPPATYFLRGMQIESEVICRLCCDPFLKMAPPVVSHQLISDDGKVRQMLIASGTIFSDEIKTLIYRFKYDRDILLAKDLSILTHGAWQEIAHLLDPASTQLTPVPLHWQKLRERTFNQSEYLASELSKLTGLALDKLALKRVKKTLSQQKLGKRQRLLNVANAFSAKASLVRGKQIILIDDVCTSGATLAACSEALYKAGASEVFAITVARVELAAARSTNSQKKMHSQTNSSAPLESDSLQTI